MEFLQQLKLDASNAGVSTGTKWISSTGENISSYSPVDGKLIGSVTATDNAAFETVINNLGSSPSLTPSQSLKALAYSPE